MSTCYWLRSQLYKNVTVDINYILQNTDRKPCSKILSGRHFKWSWSIFITHISTSRYTKTNGRPCSDESFFQIIITTAHRHDNEWMNEIFIWNNRTEQDTEQQVKSAQFQNGQHRVVIQLFT